MFIELLPSVLLGAVLLACAGGLMIWHVKMWRGARQRELESSEYHYRRCQFRRRMQTTAMLGLIALALPIGVLVMQPWPKVGVFFWGGVLLLVVWVSLLAIADVVATSYYYRRVRNDVVVEEARLRAELLRLQGVRRNGRSQNQPDRPNKPDSDDAQA